MADLNTLTVKELKALCKTNGVKGYSEWRRQQLISHLTSIGATSDEQPEDPADIVEAPESEVAANETPAEVVSVVETETKSVLAGWDSVGTSVPTDDTRGWTLDDVQLCAVNGPALTQAHLGRLVGECNGRKTLARQFRKALRKAGRPDLARLPHDVNAARWHALGRKAA